MSPQSRIDGIRLKIERAKKHIHDLDIAINAFIQEKPYGLGAMPHPVAEIQHTTLYVDEVNPIHPEITMIMGDAIHNLRCAPDHLMWQLVEYREEVPTTSSAATDSALIRLTGCPPIMGTLRPVGIGHSERRQARLSVARHAVPGERCHA